MPSILVVNPPLNDKSINRDMGGGLGYSAGKSVVLPPIDLLILTETLKQKGNKVVFCDAVAENLSLKEIVDLIEKKGVDIVLGNLSLPTLSEDAEFYKYMKSLGLRVVVKTGINYKSILEKFMKLSNTDCLVYGEPDLNIEKFLKHEGIVDGGKVDQLDRLPIPNRKKLKNELYKYGLLPEGKLTTMQTSRGCPFACFSYCPYPLVQGRVWRAMSPERVIKEIRSVVGCGIKNILFRDATFTLDMKRTEEICKLILKNKMKVNWWCETRINVLSEDLLLKMKKAGCVGINVGVESLDESLLDSEGKPGVRVEDVIRIRKAAKKIGIKMHFLMIVGLPNDSVKSLYSSFRGLRNLKPESMGFSLITPYPGTEVFDKAKKSGWIVNFDWNKFDGSNINMRTKNLSIGELRMGAIMLQTGAFFVKRKGYPAKIGLEIMDLTWKIWQKLKS